MKYLKDVFIGISVKTEIKSIQGVKQLFVLAFDHSDNGDKKVERNSHRKNLLLLIDGRNFYDQPIGDQMKKYDEFRKIATGQGDDYTTGCLLDYQYFQDHYQLIAVNLT